MFICSTRIVLELFNPTRAVREATCAGAKRFARWTDKNRDAMAQLAHEIAG